MRRSDRNNRDYDEGREHRRDDDYRRRQDDYRDEDYHRRPEDLREDEYRRRSDEDDRYYNERDYRRERMLEEENRKATKVKNGWLR